MLLGTKVSSLILYNRTHIEGRKVGQFKTNTNNKQKWRSSRENQLLVDRS
jgi:hypothetical protein